MHHKKVLTEIPSPEEFWQTEKKDTNLIEQAMLQGINYSNETKLKIGNFRLNILKYLQLVISVLQGSYQLAVM